MMINICFEKDIFIWKRAKLSYINPLFPTMIVGTAVPTRVVETVVPTRVVGTATQEIFVPAIIVGTAVPTMIVETAYYWKSCALGYIKITISIFYPGNIIIKK